MHPIICKGGTVAAFALCDFIFVVREYKVLTAAMDIDGLSEITAAHSRAFNVPAGTALTPGRFPVGLAGL